MTLRFSFINLFVLYIFFFSDRVPLNSTGYSPTPDPYGLTGKHSQACNGIFKEQEMYTLLRSQSIQWDFKQTYMARLDTPQSLLLHRDLSNKSMGSSPSPTPVGSKPGPAHTTQILICESCIVGQEVFLEKSKDNHYFPERLLLVFNMRSNQAVA